MVLQAKRERILSLRRLKMDWPLYAMMLFPVALVFVFNYIPLVGIVIAFENYMPAKGILGSQFTGFKNFETLFNMPGFYQAIRNTLTMSLWKIALGIVVPIMFTLLLNEMQSAAVRRTVQTLIYLNSLGISSIIFLGDNKWFPFTIISTHIWKEFGYGTIVYLAAVAGVNTDLYEAAQIDGAGHWKQLVHITLPSIVPIIILMTTLSLGNILNAGFDQVFNLYNTVVYESGDIIDTLVYRIGFGSGQFGLSSTAGLFKSLVSAVLVVVSYRVAYRTSGYRVF